MILFILLTLILAILAVTIALTIGIGGAAFIIVFADVIVCMIVIVWLLKKLWRRK